MEDYLKADYDMYENESLTEENIVGYFEDIGEEFFDCGQGYLQTEATVFCKIGDKYYQVDMEAEVLGHSMDRGEKLYQVEYIKSVEYKEIPKPLPKERIKATYTLELTAWQKQELEQFFKDNFIDYQASFY